MYTYRYMSTISYNQNQTTLGKWWVVCQNAFSVFPTGTAITICWFTAGSSKIELPEAFLTCSMRPSELPDFELWLAISATQRCWKRYPTPKQVTNTKTRRCIKNWHVIHGNIGFAKSHGNSVGKLKQTEVPSRSPWWARVECACTSYTIQMKETNSISQNLTGK